jgi:hypothetical protein
MTSRIATWYRTHRWLRWSIDVAVVLLLVVVVALVHTLILGGAGAYQQLRFLESASGH